MQSQIRPEWIDVYGTYKEVGIYLWIRKYSTVPKNGANTVVGTYNLPTIQEQRLKKIHKK